MESVGAGVLGQCEEFKGYWVREAGDHHNRALTCSPLNYRGVGTNCVFLQGSFFKITEDFYLSPANFVCVCQNHWDEVTCFVHPCKFTPATHSHILGGGGVQELIMVTYSM